MIYFILLFAPLSYLRLSWNVLEYEEKYLIVKKK